jgi:hypothetical protein
LLLVAYLSGQSDRSSELGVPFDQRVERVEHAGAKQEQALQRGEQRCVPLQLPPPRASSGAPACSDVGSLASRREKKAPKSLFGQIGGDVERHRSRSLE